MQACRVFHPPSAATALIMTMGGTPTLVAMGWGAVVPTAIGSTVICTVGLLNRLGGRKYPVYWL